MRNALIAVLSFLLAALAGAGLFWRLRPAEPVKAFQTFEVGGQRLQVASAYVLATSRSEDPASGPQFVAFLPDFKPAGGYDDVSVHTAVEERFQRLVFISPRAADPKLDPAERTERLYERFLSRTSWSHPGELIARAFEDDSPFAGDELFYAPPEGREFAARCRRPDPTRKTPNTCMAVTRLGDLDIEMRFTASQLEDWRNILARTRGFIEAARR